MKRLTKTLLITGIVLLSLLFFFSACSKTVYVPVERVTTVKEIETVRDTLVQVRLVPYYAEVITTQDSSYLDNAYAFSRAAWNGKELTHTLGIFEKEIPVEVQYVDRFVYRTDSIPVAYPVTEYREVNRLSTFQAFQVWCGRVFFLLFFGGVLLKGFRGGWRL